MALPVFIDDPIAGDVKATAEAHALPGCCPHPFSTLNKEKSKLSASINEVKVDFFNETALETDVVEIVREWITAFAERRIVVKFIVLGS